MSDIYDDIMKKTFIATDRVDFWPEFKPDRYSSAKLYHDIESYNATVTINGESHTFKKKPDWNNDREIAFSVMVPAEVQRAARKEAWELARKICGEPDKGGFTLSELKEIFDTSRCAFIFRDFTPEEALAKVKAWEEKKNKKPEPKEMTVAEIEKALGYPVKIVKEANK